MVLLGYSFKSDNYVLVSLITNQLIPNFGNAPHDPMGSSHWVPTSRVNNSYGIFG
jgi:hypothetical protein